jgi:hypothetical protein
MTCCMHIKTLCAVVTSVLPLFFGKHPKVPAYATGKPLQYPAGQDVLEAQQMALIKKVNRIPAVAEA